MRGICPEEILYLSLATRKNNNEPLISGNEPYSMHVRSGPVTLVAGVLILMVALLFAAGCSGSTPPSPPPTPVYTPQTTILIGSAGVNPQILVVSRGVTVTWLNLDMGVHIITSDAADPDAFTSPPLTTNHRYQFTFTIPGTYGYHSTDNPTIKGTVIVQ